MHLKQLKLVGFKSFVEPTIIPFPSQLVAVVGPNGCGKSNVIDAVRWVLGESSAKNLRGESMVDVIFNGSANRKAVGQASVELTFDNSLGRLTGQYAAYQEIIVKRLVNRDGESAYFLNGTRCRKRDIIDIFLGTGAGSRSYSIIGQGTISRIVEAKPEELRVFLEEAAGISRYKERRKETLQRIAQTRENLLRIADIREELDKQLQRLERQSRQAARYQELVAEEKQYQAEIAALKWQELKEEQASMQKLIAGQNVFYEQHQALAAEAYSLLTRLKEEGQDKNKEFQSLQEEFYQLAAEIARQEEINLQSRREQERLVDEQNQLQQETMQLQRQVKTDEEIARNTQTALEATRTQLNAMEGQLWACEEILLERLKEEEAWRSRFNQTQMRFNKSLQEQQSFCLQEQHLKKQLQNVQVRIEKLNSQRNTGAGDALLERIHTLDSEHKERQHLFEQTQQALATQEQQIDANKEELIQFEQRIRAMQQEMQQLRIEEATLQAHLQASAQANTRIDALDGKPRLLDKISVASPWHKACEFVLGSALQGVILDSLDELWPKLHSKEVLSGYFLVNNTKCASGEFTSLADKIEGFIPPLAFNLNKIRAVESLSEGLQCLPSLKTDESIITPEGYWFCRDWLYIPQNTNPDGILVKKERLTLLREKLVQQTDLLDQLQQNHGQLVLVKTQYLQNFDKLRREKLAIEDDLRSCTHEISKLQQQLQFLQQQKINWERDYADALLDIENLAAQIVVVEEQRVQSSRTLGEIEHEKNQLEKEKEVWDGALKTLRQTKEQYQQQIHHLVLQQERESLLQNQLAEKLVTYQQRLEDIEHIAEDRATRLWEIESKVEAEKVSLAEKMIRHQQLEHLVSSLRQNMEELNAQQMHYEQQHRSAEAEAKKVQEQIQQYRLTVQALIVRADDLHQQLSSQDLNPNDIATTLADISWQMREKELQETVAKIARLGAINLAAIEEYETESARKRYLDEQHGDLCEALTTLETAIHKMDKETTQRLQLTFTEVNNSFQKLFPRLFGGGCAKLELTCDNLLEAGIIVMAQPPGKRNSTIHLLSGGEKAMTAVALVFAIFQLNPSPFCMLDEVDAPLDDVNVGRFCALVREMSQLVQFLFITHNKITMELADHLIGVTMREPGVSRIVAVDVEEALTMAES